VPAFTNGSRQVKVAIACNELVTPAKLRLGPDTRDLGFCLREFLVTYGAEAA
jgi:hypothetical protein